MWVHGWQSPLRKTCALSKDMPRKSETYKWLIDWFQSVIVISRSRTAPRRAFIVCPSICAMPCVKCHHWADCQWKGWKSPGECRGRKPHLWSSASCVGKPPACSGSHAAWILLAYFVWMNMGMGQVIGYKDWMVNPKINPKSDHRMCFPLVYTCLNHWHVAISQNYQGIKSIARPRVLYLGPKTWSADGSECNGLSRNEVYRVYQKKEHVYHGCSPYEVAILMVALW